jgi:hypothetical protein
VAQNCREALVFCLHWGQAVTERKQVTVLFADLKGDGAPRPPRSRGGPPLLDPVLELMLEAVHRYERTMNQLMADGIVPLFDAPLAHEDHAARACSQYQTASRDGWTGLAPVTERTTGIRIRSLKGLAIDTRVVWPRSRCRGQPIMSFPAPSVRAQDGRQRERARNGALSGLAGYHDPSRSIRWRRTIARP